jgi:hypothetical protein
MTSLHHEALEGRTHSTIGNIDCSVYIDAGDPYEDLTIYLILIEVKSRRLPGEMADTITLPSPGLFAVVNW